MSGEGLGFGVWNTVFSLLLLFLVIIAFLRVDGAFILR